MKRFLTLIFLSSLILILAACSGSDQTSGEEPIKEEEQVQEEKEVQSLTAEEVYQKTTEATNELDSFSMEMVLNQEMTVPSGTVTDTEANTEAGTENEAEGDTEATTENETEADTEATTEDETEADAEATTEDETEADAEATTENETEANTETITATFNATMDFVVDPLSYYMNMSADMPELGEDLKIEMYLAEDGMYIYEPVADQWIKTSREDIDLMMGDITEMQMDPAQQLAMFENFTDEFAVEELENEYVLTFSSLDNSLIDIVKQFTPNLDETPGLEEVLDSMKFNELSYTINIDKETFLPTTFEMFVDMSMDVEGETLTIKQDATGSYTNINGVDSITVPDDVKTNAIDAPNAFSEFEGLDENPENPEENDENSTEETENQDEQVEEPAENTEL